MNDKNIIISKELLSLVLDDKVKEIITDMDELYDEYQIEDESCSTIVVEYYPIGHNEKNVHELAQVCKKWCAKNGFHLVEYINTVEIIERAGCNNIAKQESMKEFDVNNVYKATEWVAKEKGLLK